MTRMHENASDRYYSQKIEMPKTRRDGLANFVQMIINCIEAGDHREALLKAVDLHQEISTGVYDSAMIDATAVNLAVKEASQLAQKREEDAFHRGYDSGIANERTRIVNLLGLAA